MTPAWMRRLFVQNGSLKLIAFILTLALFIWVREDRESAVTGFVPIRAVIPDDLVITSEPPERVRITVGGRWSDLNKFDPSQLPPVTLEVDQESQGLVPITADMLRLPPGLRVTSIQPSYVRVDLEPAASKTIPIRPRIVGEPAESFELGDVRIRPPKLNVTGPQSAVEDLQYVWTEPIDVTDRTETFEKRVQLRLDNPFIQYDVDRVITAEVPISTQEVTRTIQDVSVVGVDTTYATTVRPSTITVTVRGPKPIVDRMSHETIYAAVDLAAENERPPGTFTKQARIVNLPPEVTLVTFHPNDFLVTTERAPKRKEEKEQAEEKEADGGVEETPKAPAP